MILDSDTLQRLQAILNVAKLISIDTIIIEPGRIRGFNTNKTACIFQEDIPEFEFGSIGITRLPTFQSRLDLIRTQQDYTITAIIDEESNSVRSLVMKAKSMKIDYRCANPATLQAPAILADSMKYKVALEPNAIDLLQKATVAMQTDEVSIISNDVGVSFELTDTNGDVLSYQFAVPSQVETNSPGIATNFKARYNTKILLVIFKEAPEEKSFYVGEKGVLRFPIYGINIFVIPNV